LISKFIRKIFIFLLIILLISLLLEVKINININKKNQRYYVQFDWFDNKNHNSDILFIGNSRTWVQVDPIIIQDSANYTCEIVAADGQGPQLLFAKVKNYLKSNKSPRVMVLQFDPHFLAGRYDLFGDKNWSAGYFLNRLDLQDIKLLKGYKYYYSYMPLWGIDRKTRLKILLNKKIGTDSLFEKTHGYFPNDLSFQGEWNTNNVIGVQKNDSFYDSLIVLANNFNIQVVLTTPPYSPILNSNSPNLHSDLKNVYSNLSKKHKNLSWIWLNDKNIFNDSIFFYNHLHLNKKGSKIYSQLLGSYLSKNFL
jgi:hypothetical protein